LHGRTESGKRQKSERVITTGKEANMNGQHLFLGGPLDGRRLNVANHARFWSRVTRDEIGAVNRAQLDAILDAGAYHRVSVPARLTDASLTKPLGVVFYRHHTLSDLEALAQLVEGYRETRECTECCPS
jgi:hypothetical protein